MSLPLLYRTMRFGRHLKEVLVPGKEQDCVRYDELKAAIKTQLSARWGPSGDSDSGPSDADETTTGRLDSLEDGLLASSEAEEEEAHELLARRRRAFYTLLSAELERVSRQYDASLVQLRRKVASLLGEARRGSVLDSLQLGAEELDGGQPRVRLFLCFVEYLRRMRPRAVSCIRSRV